MKPIRFKDLRGKLLKAGFYEVGQTGSHVKFARIVNLGTITATVPKHTEIAAGTLRSILRQAGISESEFAKL